tara:strand:+ start:127 stop:531 length:405 start_codon:yes stop_codon:yes gene_type:complete
MKTVASWSVRIYFEDTDSGGVVYHANYLKFMERARTEWLRGIGLDQAQLKLKDNIMFVVSKLNIEFKKPAKFNDELTVITNIEGIGASTIFINQEILKDNHLISSARVEIACINSKLFKPQRIPKETKQILEKL